MNISQKWQGIQVITDYKATPPPCDNNINFPNKLNNHFWRFEALNNNIFLAPMSSHSVWKQLMAGEE